MRVVAGKYRGKNLLSPKDESVRPTTTRIKETLFNILQSEVPSAKVLDLFAGSGALGIECLSRGADEVIFNDKSRDSIALINQNLRGIEGKFSVTCRDFMAALLSAQTSGKRFDIIFLDPPYASDLAERAIDAIIAMDLLGEDGVIVFEHGAEKIYTPPAAYKTRTKKMGTVIAEFIKKKRIGLMTGSFDPVTRGHEEVLEEALETCDEVIVACLVNPDKTYTFSSAQRLALADALCSAHKGSRAIYSEKLAVEVAKDMGASTLIRGVRDETDLTYEEDMAKYNRKMGVDTQFIRTSAYAFVSSTRVRQELASGDLSNLPAACVPIYLSKDFANLKDDNNQAQPK